ncbi:MAG: hypothetical protein JXB34_05970 [Bacteroidales bacterium]|nr:hypothetical protein [Bacteroidales bacterium]
MKNSYTKTFATLLISGLSLIGFGQNNLMYYMGNLPQSYYLNPATQPVCNVFISAPLMNYNLSMLNSAISPSDFFWYDSSLDSVVNPFTSNASFNKFIDKFDKIEHATFQGGIDILSFGFRSNSMYFAFDISAHTQQRIEYPKSLVEFITKGNTNNSVYDLSGLNFQSLNYMQFALNISKSWGDIFSVGIRPKLIYGLAAIETQENDITLSTSTDEWQLNAHSATRIAVTGLNIPVDEDGLIDFEGDFEFDSTLFDSPSNIIRTMNKNRGFGLDIGAHFKPVDQLQFSASVLNLGYIKWADKPQSVLLDGEYTFSGAEFSTSDTTDAFENIFDTLRNSMSLSGNDKPFKTGFNPVIIAGGRVFLTQRIDVGLLSRTQFYNNYTDQDFILLANFRPLRAFSFSMSYSMLGRGYSTIGLGWSVKVGPFQSYFISEYNPFRYDRIMKGGEPYKFDITDGFGIPAVIPVDVYGFSIRAGFNLVIGCNRAKKLRQDKPMFNSTNWMF